MAEGTRLESMEMNLRKLQSIVQQYSTAIEQWVSSSNSGLEETRRQLGDQSRQMSDLQSKIEENRVRTEESSDRSSAGATSAELCILGDSGETSSYNFGSCPRSPPVEASESSDRSLSRLEHSDEGGNADLEPKPAKSEVKSGLVANVQQRGILECPSTEIRAPKVVSTFYTPPYQEEDRHGNIEDLRRSTMNEPSELNREASSEFQEDGWAQQEIEVLETTTDEVCPVLYVSSMEVLGPPQIEEDQGTDEFKPSTVILDPIVVVREIEYEEIRELVKESMALIEIKWIDIKISSLVVDMPSAYKVFDVLPRRDTVVVDGKKSIGTYMNLLAIVLPYDRDGLVIFDPGGVFTFFVTEIRQMTSFPSEVEVTREAEFFSLRWQWDPGGKA